MTKEAYLYKLIDKKDSYDLPVITFPSKTIVVNTKQNLLYQGVVRLSIDEGELCLLIESLKGIVEPIVPYLQGEPTIDFRIDTTKLRTNYLYEDQLICYYPGGKGVINMSVIAHEDKREISDDTSEQESKQKTFEGLSLRKPIEHKNQDQMIDIVLPKLAYTPDEAITMQLINKSKRPMRMVLECDDELVSPKMTEIFLNEKWNQEWFIRQNTMDRLLGKFSFKSEPFRVIQVKVFFDNSFKADRIIEILLTGYEPYETTETIQDEATYNRRKSWIFHQYILRIIHNVSRREVSELFELSKACLNYNPKDVDLRLLFIWLLYEYGHRREAVSEFKKFEKYSDYYSNHERATLIDLVGHIVEKEDIDKNLLDLIDAQSHWLEILIKARSIRSKIDRYNVYKELYDSGLRHSLMFAEVTNLLNQSPVIPNSDDQFYFVTLKWAFNKRAIRKDWFNKLDRHYYQIEKSEYLTSRLVKGLYDLRKTKNLLRLYVSLSIREERYDLDSFDMYEDAMKQKLYIQDVEEHYLMAAWMNKESINLELLRHLTKITHMDSRIKAYLFVYVILHKSKNQLMYRRLRQEMIDLISGVNQFYEEIADCTYLMMEELIKGFLPIFEQIITTEKIASLYVFESGKKFIRDIIVLCLSKNPKLSEDVRVEYIKICSKAIGLEGMTVCMGEQSQLLYEYVKEHQSPLLSKLSDVNFLPIKYYESLIKTEKRAVTLLKHILVDSFLDEILATYDKLTDYEKVDMGQLVYNYIAKRVIVDDMYIDEELCLRMYDYFIRFDEGNKGILLALIKGSVFHQDSMKEQMINIKNYAMKHVIILPWIGEEMDVLSIDYLAREDDKVYICYRYEEHDVFQQEPMNHIAYGYYTYSGKLFYGESFEYYLIVEHGDISREITVSNKINKVDLYEKENYHVDFRLDSIALCFEIDDDVSAKELINEQMKYNQLIRKIPRY